MKRFLAIIISVSLLLSLCSVALNAQEQTSINYNESLLIKYDDGSYITVSVGKFGNVNSRGSVSDYKSYTYRNGSGEVEWVYTLYGTFAYVYGTSSTCTKVSYDYTIYDDSWEFSNGSCSRSGGTAYGYGTFKNKVLFITTKTINIDANLTCDIYGNLS